jgi:hypothetical protein
MRRRLPHRPDPEKDALERKGGYIVRGELLLTDHEWSGGFTPDVKTLTQRRREVGLEPCPTKVSDVTRTELRARAPIRARVVQADMADTPLFGQQVLL